MTVTVSPRCSFVVFARGFQCRLVLNFVAMWKCACCVGVCLGFRWEPPSGGTFGVVRCALAHNGMSHKDKISRRKKDPMDRVATFSSIPFCTSLELG